MWRMVVASFLGVAVVAGPWQASAQPRSPAASMTTPAPISGRTLANPELLKPADILARLVLATETLELIHKYMGRPTPAKPFIKVSNVSDSETFFASLNLTRSGLQFAFEQLRVEQKFDSKLPPKPAAHHIFGVVDGLLKTALMVKNELGIAGAVSERAQPDSTSMTDVFNQILVTAELTRTLIDKRTQDRDVYLILTVAIRQALELHQKFSTKLMPDEPVFEANKTPADVLRELETGFELLRKLGERMGVPMLTFQRADGARVASQDSTFGFALIVIAEFDLLLAAAEMERKLRPVGSLGRKFPSHSYQRVRHINAIVRETLDSQKR